MFEDVKKNDIDLELTTNPDILFETDIDTSQLKVHGFKIDDKADGIPVDQVSTTTFEKYPLDGLRTENGKTLRVWRNNKVFYHSKDGEKEYLLLDRINSVIDFGGILHMKSGAKYVVRDKKIIGIGIHNGLVESFKKLKKLEIESKFGKASEIKENYEEIDGTLFNTEFIFKTRDMKIIFDDWDKEIVLINIGLFSFTDYFDS